MNSDFIQTLYKVVAKIISTKAKEQVAVPDMPGPDADGNEPSEDDKQDAMQRIENAQRINSDIERFNNEVSAIHSKVKVAHRQGQSE